MNIQKSFMALVMTVWGGQSMAQSQTYKIDMGSVHIKAMEASSTETISHVMPADCPDTILKIQSSGGSVSISHAGKRCKSGAQIVIPIRLNVDTNLTLAAGNVEFTDAQSAVTKLSEIRLAVNAGAIRSSTVPSTRTSDYAGQKGTLRNSRGNGHSLSIQVEAGTIGF